MTEGEKGEEGKVHMVSAAGLLETSHRIPNLDYDIFNETYTPAYQINGRM